jgi:S-DNA-T family DNA segregation ATPase FtsK/SpoIIIE
MPIEQIEQEVADAYHRLAGSAAVLRYCHEHYLDQLTAAHRDGSREAERQFVQRRADVQASYCTEIAAGEAARSRAVGQLAQTVAAVTAAQPWAVADFTAAAWDAYQPDSQAPPPAGLRVGIMTLGQVAGTPGQAAAKGLPLIPAVARFTGHGHVLIAENGFADQARSLLQALALRLAAASRPGTVRFALADPVGHGQYLSAFLRLPGELRLGPGVATTTAEIEALLAALAGHVVDVTQARLTNVYESIEAYNQASSGTAVPYHVLVLAGFPSGISDRAAETLTRLAHGGPRAGVYVVATLDTGQDLPRGFDLAALTALGTNLRLASPISLTWDDPDLGAAVIEPDQMPAAASVNPWLDAVASAAAARSRDLPFERIAIAPAQRWAAETTDGLDVQIGVDARGEPQRFMMGSGRVYHGLVGGDVGTGKSNLLHVLITQLALRYPPEELELYLLDFKQVEFDAYLTGRLPHARAISSRTDREFGLSMLRRFHDEIDRRAVLCQGAGVTELSDYRRQTGIVLPRALVIMDEFQVLFGEEDRITREAARLLTDIAQRGRAFGLHLLLATQSPGGPLRTYLQRAYEQMTLRVALGCAQPSVSQAILGDGNDAATRLTQPGDAIYNDRRGEGANPEIRIAKLPTPQRLELITQIRTLAGSREYPPPASFDPDASADFATYPACAAFAAAPGQWPEPDSLIEAWLGEAIEIKPATTAAFERGMGANLLVVGGEEHGHGLLMATLLSAAIQRSPADVAFTVVRFAKPSSPYHGFWDLAGRLPHEVRVAGQRTAVAELAALIADLDERLGDGADVRRPERFFIVAGLHRWPELAAERDYRPSETSAVAMLTRLADLGPEAGIHVVVWTGSYASTERALRRQGIAHFGLRAVLRVSSPAESDALLAAPGADSLASDRALFRDMDEPDEIEKFKPYSIESLRKFVEATFRSTP